MKKLTPEVVDLVARRFWVLSEPARLTILNALLEGEHTVSELIDAAGLRQANLSRHLQLLRTGDFVSRRKEGQFAYYQIADPSVAELCDIMCRRLEEGAERRQAVLEGA